MPGLQVHDGVTMPQNRLEASNKDQSSLPGTSAFTKRVGNMCPMNSSHIQSSLDTTTKHSQEERQTPEGVHWSHNHTRLTSTQKQRSRAKDDYHTGQMKKRMNSVTQTTGKGQDRSAPRKDRLVGHRDVLGTSSCLQVQQGHIVAKLSMLNTRGPNAFSLHHPRQQEGRESQCQRGADGYHNGVLYGGQGKKPGPRDARKLASLYRCSEWASAELPQLPGSSEVGRESKCLRTKGFTLGRWDCSGARRN